MKNLRADCYNIFSMIRSLGLDGLCVGMSLILAGCSGAQSKNEFVQSSGNVANPQKSLISFQQESWGGQLASELKVKKGQCQTEWQKVSKKWDLKKAILVASGCVAANELDFTDKIAQELAHREPQSGAGAFYQAVVSYAKKGYDRALWMLGEAERRKFQSASVQHLYGLIFWEQHSEGLAISRFEKACELEPSLVADHEFLGRIYLRDQFFDRAQKHFELALRYESDSKVALEGIAESLDLQNKKDAAIAAYTRFHNKYSQEHRATFRLAQLLENNNEQELALSYYKKITAAKSSRDIASWAPVASQKVVELEKLLALNKKQGGNK